jgi:Protein of unknown function (DUF3159)
VTDARAEADEHREDAADTVADTVADPAADDAVLPAEAPARQAALVDAFGGRRGLFDSTLPVLVFVFVNSLATAAWDSRTGLRVALGAALAAGLVVVALRLARRQTVQQAFSGFLALALAAWLANRSGEARDFHLPHILYQIAYGAAFLVSVLLRRPLVGYVYAAVDGLTGWRDDRRLRRVFTVATLGWAAVFGTRAVVLGSLYLADRSGWLAVARLVLGWPVTISAVAATIAYVRRTRALP